MKGRELLEKASVAAPAVAAGAVVNAPFVHASRKTTIK